MYPSPTRLPETARIEVGATLDQQLCDALDLTLQIKVAHWNVKGPMFVPLHAHFDELAKVLANQADAIAERAVTIGTLVHGSARQVARVSRLPEYPPDTTRDLDHVRLLAERFDDYLEGLRESRKVAERFDDPDTYDLLTATIRETEKQAWSLWAMLER